MEINSTVLNATNLAKEAVRQINYDWDFAEWQMLEAQYAVLRTEAFMYACFGVASIVLAIYYAMYSYQKMRYGVKQNESNSDVPQTVLSDTSNDIREKTWVIEDTERQSKEDNKRE